MTEQIMTPEQVAAFLQVAPRTLERWRSDRRPEGPRFLRVGRHVRYRRSDVDAYIEGQAAAYDQWLAS